MLDRLALNAGSHTIRNRRDASRPLKEIMKKKKSIQEVLDAMPSYVALDYHDRGFLKAPKKTNKLHEKAYGFELQPQLYHPVIIRWSEKGRGFGEYAFWQRNGKIYCDNEEDSRETVKRILCRMVDQAIFENEMTDAELKDHGIKIGKGFERWPRPKDPKQHCSNQEKNTTTIANSATKKASKRLQKLSSIKVATSLQSEALSQASKKTA